ncbi:MAG: hypothetical protein R3E31_09530 [Chloroflexota bacterium]
MLRRKLAWGLSTIHSERYHEAIKVLETAETLSVQNTAVLPWLRRRLYRLRVLKKHNLHTSKRQTWKPKMTWFIAGWGMRVISRKRIIRRWWPIAVLFT